MINALAQMFVDILFFGTIAVLAVSKKRKKIKESYEKDKVQYIIKQQ